MRNGRYDEALKPLQMVAKLDHGNRKSRYYREECSKYVTKDGRLREIRSARARLKKNGKSLLSFLIVSGNPTVQTVVNIMIGIVIGIAVVGFLIVPGVRQHANLNANKSIVSSGETLTSQNSQIKKLQEDLQTAKTAKKDAQKKVKKSEQKSESYEKLLISYDYYKSLSYDKAMSYLEEVDKDSLSADAKKIYDTISEKAGKTVAFTSYAKGNVSYFLKKYDAAIKEFTKVVKYAEDYKDGKVAFYLAKSYYETKSYKDAKKWYQTYLKYGKSDAMKKEAEAAIKEIDKN